MTDHDFRAMALGYAESLSDLSWLVWSSGSFAQKAAAVSGGSVRLLAESSSATVPAAVTLQVKASPTARNKLRSSLAGITLTQRITSAVLNNGARYEVVMPLSYHPATAGRPAGQYQLVYRFGGRVGRWTQGNGLTGVVGAATPAAGSVQVLKPATDIAAIWPDLVAMDNCFYGLSLVARSPKRSVTVDTSSNRFYRVQVRNSAGEIVGTGNPVWLLRQAPPSGIPGPRQ